MEAGKILRRNTLLISIGSILIFGFVLFAVSPNFAVRGLHKTLEGGEGDPDKISQVVDFASMREQLIEDMDAATAMPSEINLGAGGPGGPLRGMESEIAALLGSLGDQVVEMMVSPSALAALISEGNSLDGPLASYTISWRSLNQFVASFGEDDPGLVFTRRGLRWQVTKFELPPDALEFTITPR